MCEEFASTRIRLHGVNRIHAKMEEEAGTLTYEEEEFLGGCWIQRRWQRKKTARKSSGKRKFDSFRSSLLFFYSSIVHMMLKCVNVFLLLLNGEYGENLRGMWVLMQRDENIEDLDSDCDESEFMIWRNDWWMNEQWLMVIYRVVSHNKIGHPGNYS